MTTTTTPTKPAKKKRGHAWRGSFGFGEKLSMNQAENANVPHSANPLRPAGTGRGPARRRG